MTVVAVGMSMSTVAVGGAVPVDADHDGGQPEAHWVGAWTAAQQPPNTLEPEDWSVQGFADQTVRQVVRVTTGGPTIRVRLSNVYGSTPLHVTGATVAATTEGAGVDSGSIRELSFAERESVMIRAGEELASDPLRFPVKALDELTVTLYFKQPTGPVSYHGLAVATSYRADGDHRFDAASSAFRDTAESWYALSGVEVAAAPETRSIVTFGDSITDGAESTVDANNRYPDQLAERLVAAGSPHSVLNAGISGNRLLNDSVCFGERATKRFQRDVLEQPKVRSVVILEGINDIGFSADNEDPCKKPNPEVTAEQLIEVHRELIERAHAEGIRAIGVTVLPFKGADYYTERGERVRQQVNKWIRTSGEYDAVIDFDRLMADPKHPDRLLPRYDSGDALHPSDAGYQAMAEGIDVQELVGDSSPEAHVGR